MNDNMGVARTLTHSKGRLLERAVITVNLCKTATLKKTRICFQDQLSLNAGQKYCRMLQGEHSAILPTFIKLPLVIKIFVLSIFKWPFYTGFTVESFASLLIKGTSFKGNNFLPEICYQSERTLSFRNGP